MPEPLRVHREGSLVRIELLAAEDFPRLSAALVKELGEILSILFRDQTCEGIVVHGNDRAFASGAEIVEVGALTPTTALSFSRQAQEVFERMATAPKPVVAAIAGYCLGGGLDLALACWRRVATPEAVFAHPGTTLGLVTGWGGTQRLARLVGRSRALELLLTGKRINGTTAYEMGLVDTLVSAGELISSACALARELVPRADLTRARQLD